MQSQHRIFFHASVYGDQWVVNTCVANLISNPLLLTGLPCRIVICYICLGPLCRDAKVALENRSIYTHCFWTGERLSWRASTFTNSDLDHSRNCATILPGPCTGLFRKMVWSQWKNNSNYDNIYGYIKCSPRISRCADNMIANPVGNALAQLFSPIPTSTRDSVRVTLPLVSVELTTNCADSSHGSYLHRSHPIHTTCPRWTSDSP